MNGSADRKVENYLSDVDDRILNELKERNAYLEAKLKENEQSLLRQRDEIKSEYQNFVDQLQHQIESLVDQINRMTDERETAFAKLDSLETMLNKSNNQNDTLISDFNELKKKYDEAILAGPSNSTDNNESDSNGSSNKEQLLENEIKYFKQQIEILVQDHNGLIKLVDEKEQAITNFNKLIENYESERGQHSTLLDQAHNDKQALSRALQQNKDLKKQLEELQDAFVNVTQQNLDLTTKLQAEEFKAKQIAEAEEVKIEQSTVFSNADEVNGQPIVNENEVEERKDLSDESGEWGEGENEEKIELSKDSTSDESLMDGIKKRIQDLEKENKDLNDYIALVNRELEKNSEAAKKSDDAKNKDNQHSLEQEEIIDRQLRKIEDLNENIKALEDERTKLNENLKDYESKMAESSKQIETVDSKVEDIKVNSSQSDLHSANFKLLEEKFTKVMKENADLKDKNQELEHTILQLQCETDTIVDYITMYQVERKKLNQKYKEKDESIRSLSTQLQLNKLALSEISNYLSAFMKFSEPPEKKIKLPQKEDNTEGQDSIENELTEIEQIEDSLNEIEKVADQEFQKKQHLLTEMEKLLNTLTQDSNNTLNKVNSAVIDNKKINSAHETHNGHGHSHNHKALHNKSIDDSSVKNFRSEIILCSSCDGELFIV